MAASGAPVRQLRRGPAPIASFDHDGSDESSPETKQTFRLPEIREDPAGSASSGHALAPPELRARSHSTPAVPALLAGASALGTPAAPRIDISRASSSSHHDSRDSSPELALFAGTGGDESKNRLELGFREDGALELRSSTEELAFLEGAPGEPRPAALPAPPSRRHSRKDSQGSEAALLAVSGRTSRLSSVGSQCSAHSALSAFSHQSRVSVGRLSVVSGISRSPSPHRMLLETSFCGPKPIETDPEICAAAVEERLLEIGKMSATSPGGTAPQPLDARDRREIRTEATVERAVTRAPPPSPLPVAAPALTPTPAVAPTTPAISTAEPAPAPTLAPDDDKFQKETQNRARAQERRARPRVRREPSEPEVYKTANRAKNIIRIKLKPDDDYEEEESEGTLTVAEVGVEMARKPDTLELVRAARPSEVVACPSSPTSRPTEARVDPATASPSGSRRLPRDSRTPSPAGAVVSRKSSFCSLFKSRETIASPDSPSDALRRKRSLTEGRSRSKSRDRSATPTSTGKIRGSVLSLFRTPRKSATSPSPSSREGSPIVQPQRQITAVPSQPVDRSQRGDKLKYYEDTKDGIIHIPLRTPPDERPGSSGTRRGTEGNKSTVEVTTHREPTRPASAPHPRPVKERDSAPVTQKPMHRTVLPDGSIIIPLRSPTERPSDDRLPSPPVNTIPPTKEVSDATQVETQSNTATTTAPRDTPTPTRDSGECAATLLPTNSAPVEAANNSDEGRRRRKERLVFTTHVGSREQVFSTQFSITKTPSVTSEISGSFPSFADGDEARPTITREQGVVQGGAPAASPGAPAASPGAPAASPGAPSPASTAEAVRDSSESEPSSESAPPIAGDDVEKRGLVVQQSFEEELPYVPTTLPQERSVALPMVPVRERGGVRVSGVSRPRAALSAPPTPRPAPSAPCPAPHAAPPAPAAPPSDKLRIRLPRRPNATAAPRAPRPRARSGSDCLESHHPKAEWIDFSEVPERRKQPKRIQTLPAAAGGAAVVFSYVEPEHCRCECHHSDAPSAPYSAGPEEPQQCHSASPSDGACEADADCVQLSVQVARPFVADLDLHPDHNVDEESRSH